MIMNTQSKQTGVTIIELMIALVIGSVIMVGVGTVYSSSKRSYKTQEEFSRLQENGRFAMNYIARFVRGAGFSGCASGLDSSSFTNDLNTPNTLEWNFSTGIEGYEASGTGPGQVLGSALAEYPDASSTASNWTIGGGATVPLPLATGSADSVVPHSDVLVSRSADGAGVEISKNNSGAQLFLNCTGVDPDGCGSGSPSYSGLCDGDILLVSDCKKSIAFQGTNIQTTGSGASCEVNVAHAAGGGPGNAVTSWGGANPGPERLFKKGDEMLKVSTKVFYVGKGTNGPALFLKQGNSAGQELVEGVETLQVLYGEDTDAAPDNVPNRYVAADKVVDFSNVVAVRISILLRSLKELPHRDNTTNTFLLGGTTAASAASITAPTDKRMRRVMSMTIKLRNRAFSL